MRGTLTLKRFGVFLLALMLLGCSSLEQKKRTEVSLPSPQVASPAENPPASEPAPPVPPPLLSLKKPAGAADLESPVSLTVTEGSLKEVLQALTEQAGINLILDRDVVDENVTLNIKKLPLWQALDGLLTAHNLYYSSQPGYIRISRMMTRTFHLDYIRSLRAGVSNTQVSLSSGSNAGQTTSQISTGSQSTTTLGALGGGTASGDITIASQEVVDFWNDFDKNLRQIMRDPLYKILRTEYDQKDLRRDLRMLPYREEYEREAMKEQLESLRLHQELMRKRLETGVTEAEGTTAAETISPEAPSAGIGGTERETTQERGTEEEQNLVGTYSLDPQTGTLVVTTTPEVMSRVESFLGQLRQNLNRQVHIDVQILEVSLSDDKQLGVDWSAFPGLIQYYRMPQLTSIINSQMLQQAQSGGGGGTGTTGGQGVSSPLSTSPFSSSPQGSLQLGVLSTIGSHQAVQYAMNSVISFLEQYGTVRALSRPQITTLNNQPAVVSVGVNDFYVTFEQQTTSAQAGLATSAVTSRLNPIFIGVTLNVTPQISPEGEIALKIVPAVNKKVGEKVVPTGIPSSPNQTIPLLETRQTSTLVRVTDAETIVISGLIQENEDKREKNVPYLGALPVAGQLFRHTTTLKGHSELVILLTPRCAERPLTADSLGYSTVTKRK